MCQHCGLVLRDVSWAQFGPTLWGFIGVLNSTDHSCMCKVIATDTAWVLAAKVVSWKLSQLSPLRYKTREDATSGILQRSWRSPKHSRALKMWMSKSKVRDDALFSILAELAGPRLHELKPYEAICWPCCDSLHFVPLALDRADGACRSPIWSGLLRSSRSAVRRFSSFSA